MPTATASPFRYRGWSLFSLLAALVLLMTGLILVLNPDLTEGVRSAIRATARSSLSCSCWPSPPRHSRCWCPRP